MKVGIMQPYFFPYLGYFSLIKAVDSFIILDDVQFIRHGWIERNRVLKQTGGWQYISIPLEKFSRDTVIKDVNIRVLEKWEEKIFAQLTHYKRKAPYYKQTIELIKDIFTFKTESLSEFNKVSLIKTSNYLGIETKIINLNDLSLGYDKPNMPDEWALNICKALNNVTNYINPIGGTSFFDPKKYEANGISLSFLKYGFCPYKQLCYGDFEPGLSIIDALMFNSLPELNDLLNCYSIE